ncbi:AP endonuclease [Mycolicibacterium anyangense]|uniref:AP endonuclease n=1 Tax=Mycolicibacterium anyangense TaxID=1431246 RepID=A0A6N4WFS5_9MYCO|nr:sugar phosphate isomerase/epimerase [Mycolicibacterium anyangense]BBZ79283.1 AP endonuclease [Mycolicibacterium anyangense]
MTSIHTRLGCSTISFRHLPLPAALDVIAGLGFTEIDLGALPGVCDHVPYQLDQAAVDAVAQVVTRSGLTARSINGDIGDLNMPVDAEARIRRDEHLDALVRLAQLTGARAVVLPCGAANHTPVRSLSEDVDLVAAELIRAQDSAGPCGVEIWTESLHFHRLCCDLERAALLTERLAGTSIGVVMDFSHIVASGGDPSDFVTRFAARIAHVHLRDATPGNINLSIGRGQVDFRGGLKALADVGYAGHFALELETRDVTDDQRPRATAEAAHLISELI